MEASVIVAEQRNGEEITEEQSLSMPETTIANEVIPESDTTETERLQAENAELKERLVLSEKMVKDLKMQVIKKDNVTDSKLVEQEATHEKVNDETAAKIEKLENAVALERKHRLEAEAELGRLKDSLNSACEKCSYVVEGFRESLNVTEVQKNLLRLKEQFDELSKYMQEQLENDEEELMTLANQIKERNQRLQNLIHRLNPERLTQLIEIPGNTTGNMEANEGLKQHATRAVKGDVDDTVPPQKRENRDDNAANRAKKRRTSVYSSVSASAMELGNNESCGSLPLSKKFTPSDRESNESEGISASLESCSGTIQTRRSARKQDTRSAKRSR